MLKNYFITSLRHIRKSKMNAAFKVVGLSLAIFSFLAIAVYVFYQLSFDRHHHDPGKLYRVNSARKENGVLEKYAIVPLAIGPMLKQYLPEVEAYTRVRLPNGSNYLRYEEKMVACEGLIEADSSFFHVLDFHFVAGDADALKVPNGIVLTKSKAIDLFGRTDVLQKVVMLNNGKQPYQVSAVIEDPARTCFYFEAVVLNSAEVDFSLAGIISPVEFVDHAATLFVRLKQPATSELQAKTESVLDRFIKKADRVETGFAISFQPLKDVYLGPSLKAEFARKGSPVYVVTFSILGIVLLIISSINYINLSIADFSTRAGETGVRKVLGARKHQLMVQVVLETVIFGVLSLVVAVTMLYLLFPQVKSLLDADLQFGMLLDKRLLFALGVGLFVLIFLSSWFPARQFAVDGIAQGLKSKSSYNPRLSNVLLCVQFTISAICISCTIVAERQISFIHNKDLGIDRKNLLVFSLPPDFAVTKMKTLKEKLKTIGGVVAVSNSSFRIGGGYWKDWYYVESLQGIRNVELYEVFSDDELFATLGIKVLEGRTFDAQIPADSGAAFVINETAARALGWTDPVGKRIYTHPEEKGKWDGTVVGMVSDINISPLYDRVLPLVMRLPWQSEYLDAFVYVRYEGEAQAVVKAIEKKYNEVSPGYPFAFRFVDELYNSSHQSENKAFASLQFSTLVIVLVSTLGIFSMAAFISMRRMREFGIRKVLGASVQQISGLHIGYFMRLALLSNVIAIPLAYFLVAEWLDTFAYRVDLTYLPFVAVAALSVLLVILSGGYSAWKSGRVNPVDVIKMQ